MSGRLIKLGTMVAVIMVGMIVYLYAVRPPAPEVQAPNAFTGTSAKFESGYSAPETPTSLPNGSDIAVDESPESPDPFNDEDDPDETLVEKTRAEKESRLTNQTIQQIMKKQKGFEKIKAISSPANVPQAEYFYSKVRTGDVVVVYKNNNDALISMNALKSIGASQESYTVVDRVLIWNRADKAPPKKLVSQLGG